MQWHNGHSIDFAIERTEFDSLSRHTKILQNFVSTALQVFTGFSPYKAGKFTCCVLGQGT